MKKRDRGRKDRERRTDKSNEKKDTGREDSKRGRKKDDAEMTRD